MKIKAILTLIYQMIIKMIDFFENKYHLTGLFFDFPIFYLLLELIFYLLFL